MPILRALRVHVHQVLSTANTAHAKAHTLCSLPGIFSQQPEHCRQATLKKTAILAIMPSKKRGACRQCHCIAACWAASRFPQAAAAEAAQPAETSPRATSSLGLECPVAPTR